MNVEEAIATITGLVPSDPVYARLVRRKMATGEILWEPKPETVSQRASELYSSQLTIDGHRLTLNECKEYEREMREQASLSVRQKQEAFRILCAAARGELVE